MSILDDIMALPDRVGTIEKQLAKLTTELREQGVTLDAVEAQGERQDGDIRNLRNDVSKLFTRTEGHWSDFKKIGERLDDHRGSLENLVDVVGGHAGDLQGLEGRTEQLHDRITALEAYHAPPEPEPVDLTKYEEIEQRLFSDHLTDWLTLSSVGHDYARHVVDGFYWFYHATGGSGYLEMAKLHANRVLDAVLARDRNLDDLRLVSGFRLLGDEEIDARVADVAMRASSIVMSTGQDFLDWSRNQHRLEFKWSPPQGEWQGVCGYYTRSTVDTNARARVLDAFRECVARGMPGVWGAGWEERYRPARSSFKAGRDVRLLELDESLRPIFEAAWGRIAHGGSIADGVTGGVAQFVDGLGATVGVPLFDGWNYVAPVGLLDHVLDDVMAGRSNLMADVNTHPTGVRQLALCGATALRRARG